MKRFIYLFVAFLLGLAALAIERTGISDRVNDAETFTQAVAKLAKAHPNEPEVRLRMAALDPDFNFTTEVTETQSDSRVWCEDVSGEIGDTINLVLMLSKTEMFNAWQIEFDLPDGIVPININGNCCTFYDGEFFAPLVVSHKHNSEIAYHSSENNKIISIGHSCAGVDDDVYWTSLPYGDNVLITLPLYITSSANVGVHTMNFSSASLWLGGYQKFIPQTTDFSITVIDNSEPHSMWLVGDAFNGWNESGNVQMTQKGNIFCHTTDVKENTYVSFFKDTQAWSHQRGPARGSDAAPLGDWENTTTGGAWKIPAAGTYTFEYNYLTDQARIIAKETVELEPFNAGALTFVAIGEALGGWNMPPTVVFTKNNDGTHSLVIDATAAEFKIAGVKDYSNLSWGDFDACVYGGATLAFGDNTLTAGQTANMTMPQGGKVKLIVSDVTESSCKLNIAVVGEADEAYYLIGSFNNWNDDTKPAFTKKGDGSFQLQQALDAGATFKVKDQNGTWYGGDYQGFGNPFELNINANVAVLAIGDNISDFVISQAGTYTFTIANGVLTVTGFPTVPQPVVEIAAVELMGSSNEWAEPLGAFAAEDASTGYWTLNEVAFAANDEFKIRVRYTDQSEKWLAPEGDGNFLVSEELLGQELTLAEGSPANMYVEKAGTLSFALAPAFDNLVITGEFEAESVVVLVTSIEINNSELALNIGETTTLTATVLPEDATDKSVAWASDNESVATVADGVVTAGAAGTATITATTADGSGLSAICTVTVNADEQPLAENRIEVENISVYSGDTFVLDLNMVNTDETLTALQFDMYLPEGLSIVNDEEYDEPLVELDEARLSRRDDHTVMVAKQNDGAIRVMTYSGTVKPFLGTDGALLHITLLADVELDDCELPIVFRDVTLTNTGEQEIVNDSMTCHVSVFKYYRGDMNGDDKVNVTDIVAIANHIMGNPSGSFIERNADLNGDNKVNVTDVVILANLVMGAGTSNAAPAPAPARAPMQSGSDENLLRFYLEDFNIEAGGTAEVSLMLETNIENLTAFEAYIDLPEGLEIFYDSEYEEYDAWVADDLKPRRDDHTVMVSSWEDGTMKMMCYSPSVKSFAAGEGAIVTMSIKASDSFAGTHEIALKNVLFTSADEQEYYLDDTTSTVTGPEMSDDGVTLADMLASGVDGGEYTVSDALAVAYACSEFAVVTDGNGNWLKVTGADLSAYGGIEAGTLSGALGGMAANPTLAVTAAPVDAIEVPYELTPYDMAAALAPKANELATVKGYYFMQNGQPVLRGYGRAPHGQSVTLDVTNVDVSNLIEGEQYVITAVVQLREAWSGAPRKVAAGGSDAYKNVSLIVTQVPGETTAITDLNADDDAPAQRYNLLGQPVDDNYRGIVIERGRKILVR